MTSPVSTFPVWITEAPTTQITFGTIDANEQGTYTFNVVASDPLTGLQNSDVSFTLELTYAESLVIVTSSIIPDQIYRVGDPATTLNVPLYTHTPANAETNYVYTLIAPTPSFVTLIGGSGTSA